MKIAFCTLGCKLNFAESSAIGKALLGQGHVRAKQGEAADVVVLNTCSVTDAADHKGRQAIHRLRRQHPQAVLIVTGCYAELKGQEIKAMPEVDYVLGANEKERVVEIIRTLDEGLRIKDKRLNSVLDEGLRIKDERRNSTDSEISASKVHTAGDTPASPVALQHGAAWRPHLLEEDTRQTSFFPACSWDDRTRCFLKVQDGCNYFCTYCTIPLARGRSRNASIADIVAQAEQALRDGAKEIVLTGVNIGDFGRSTGERFIDLLRALDELGTLPTPPYKGGSRGNSFDSDTSETKVISPSSCVLHPSSYPYRLRISSCEPNLLTDEVIDFVANSKHFAPHFHIPLQSGSNEVLKIMHRHYDRELFAERVAHIRERMPNAFIGVDCMVGVRGETEERWEDYLAFVKQLDVSQLHVFTYSERANTRMLEMDLYVVPKKERERRSKILHAVSAEKLQAFYAKHRGEEATVLWEGKKDNGMMAGFTENYIKVHAPYDKAKVNTFEVVRI
ncbi:MAG: radical SAM protein [Paludibacteraceae bacterium]|nr:radical SAM protein [Paludibacteraceae bacterium]